MNIAEIVIAASLVVLVLVFVRISWTLKEINDTLASRVNSPRNASRMESAADDSVLDENELAAVIAVAYAAYRDAV